ncbi:hypothetical protein TIFTF001_011600 [Ficus carica]|uniref:Uncharacterized protein n=1 Tax=Ficus carica TaxID=3494 RepID=A0AA88D0V5_FICCA|nr:hypothetical protein TIFTF001_011600 [Ficus carica]
MTTVISRTSSFTTKQVAMAKCAATTSGTASNNDGLTRKLRRWG